MRKFERGQIVIVKGYHGKWVVLGTEADLDFTADHTIESESWYWVESIETGLCETFEESELILYMIFKTRVEPMIHSLRDHFVPIEDISTSEQVIEQPEEYCLVTLDSDPVITIVSAPKTYNKLVEIVNGGNLHA